MLLGCASRKPGPWAAFFIPKLFGRQILLELGLLLPRHVLLWVRVLWPGFLYGVWPAMQPRRDEKINSFCEF